MLCVLVWSWVFGHFTVRQVVGRSDACLTCVLRREEPRQGGLCVFEEPKRTDVRTYTRRINSNFLFTGCQFGALLRPISDFLTHSLCRVSGDRLPHLEWGYYYLGPVMEQGQEARAHTHTQ